MCRWISYQGSPIYLSQILTNPNHSLLIQSFNSKMREEATNGDGFGIGWYLPHQSSPGVFREITPAWSSENLQNISKHIKSGLFFSHIRASSGSSIQQTNCHPFVYQNWLMQHNGSIPQFHLLKRTLILNVSKKYFSNIKGSTDSEVLFYLLLTHGLNQDPHQAVVKTIQYIEKLRAQENISEPLYLSLSISDGTYTYIVRFSSDSDSPSIFLGNHIHALKTLHHSYEELPKNSLLVVSEPLDNLSEHWQEIDENKFLTLYNGKVLEQKLF